ncbi:MAG: hypothetical protein AB7O52_16285 [Planctomycetota bacterium]
MPLSVAFARCLLPLVAPGLRLVRVDRADLWVILELRLVVASRMRREVGAATTSTVSHVGHLALGVLVGSLASQMSADLVVMACSFVFLLVVTLQTLLDYSQVLFDTTDRALIAPTPVPERTVLASRLAHVGVHVALVVVSLGLPMLVLSWVNHGFYPFVPVLLFTVIASATLAVLGSFALHLLVVRWARPEQVRDVIVLLQVVLLISVSALIQVAPVFSTRPLTRDQIEALLGERGFQFVLPPFHFRGLYAVLEGNGSAHSHWLAALAVLVPVGAVWVTFRLARGRYFALLEGFQLPTRERPVRARSGRVWRLIRRVATCGPEQRATFDLLRALAFRERIFRLRTFPLLGLVFLAALGAWLRNDSVDAALIACAIIYASALALPAILVQARYGDDWQAGWLFQALPTQRRSDLYIGHYRAVVVCFMAPLIVVGFLIGLFGSGVSAFPDLLFATAVTMLVAGVCAHFFGPYLPFQEQPRVAGDLSHMFLYLGATFLLGGAVGCHWLLRHIPHGLIVGSLAAAGGALLVDRALRTRSL